MEIDSQARELNEAIERTNPHVLAMLSKRGKRIYFPKRGILSQSAQAEGSAINATIGTALDDDGTPMRLPCIAAQTTLSPREAFSYASSYGRPEIRAAWKEMLYRKNPSLKGAEISLPVVTCALTHGLSMAGYLFVDEGDTVILPDLYWENYDLIFGHSCGARLATFPMFAAGGFNIDGLRACLPPGPGGKRIVLLNFPNNPTGYTCSIAEAQAIRDTILQAANGGNDIVVILDDAYFGLVFQDGIIRESVFTLLANMHERVLAVKLDGPTKEDYVWGFRVGFMTFGIGAAQKPLYTALEAKLAGAVRGSISNAPNVAQSILQTAYRAPSYEQEKEEKYQMLMRRYERIRLILAQHPEYAGAFVPLPFNSGYFMCVRVVSGNAEAVQQRLLKEHATGVIAFGDLIRVAFSSTPIDKIDALFANIYRACGGA